MTKSSSQQPIEQLLDAQSAAPYIARHAPAFARKHDLASLTARALKKITMRTVGEGFHHVVIRYDAPSFGEYPVFCTAYSKGAYTDDDQSREHAFRALTFLKKHAFKHSGLFLPEPLFFDRELKAFFYQGIDGQNLRAILEHPRANITAHLERAARWTAQLHRTPVERAPRELAEVSRIAQTAPGPDFFERVINERAPEHAERITRLFRELAAEEEKTLAELPKPCVIHGDLHPENVIVNTNTGQVSVTDFTDVSLGDWARDLGSFLEQLGFMSLGFRGAERTQNDQATFLAAYRAASGANLDANAERRIRLYRTWTALRNAIYFLTKKPIERAEAGTSLARAEEHARALNRL